MIKNLNNNDFQAALGSSGPTADRPTDLPAGAIYFDTDLLQNVTFNGTDWVKGGEDSELENLDEGNGSGWRILGKDANNYGDIGQNAVDLSESDTASTDLNFGATGYGSFATGLNTNAGGYGSTATGYMTQAGSVNPLRVNNVLKDITLSPDTRIATQYVTGVGYKSQVITLAPAETIYYAMATGSEPTANILDSKIYVYDVTVDSTIDATTPTVRVADSDLSGAGEYWSEVGEHTNIGGTSIDIQVVYSGCCDLTFTDTHVPIDAPVFLYLSLTTSATGLNLPDTNVVYTPAYGVPQTSYAYSSAQGVRTSAVGEGSHAEGLETITYGNYSHAQGFQSKTLKGSEELSIVPSDPQLFSDFSTAIETNGTKIVVGCPRYDIGADIGIGSVYTYDIDGTNEAKIFASDGVADDRFGADVDISATHIAVGAYKVLSGRGAAYIYDIDGTNEVKIFASDGVSPDNFGDSIALSSAKVAVGSWIQNVSTGAVYVYNLDGTGELKITASDASAVSSFGHDIAMTETKILVGADQVNGSTGAVYLYNHDGTGELKITASDGASNDRFGLKVALTDTHIIVGSYGVNLPGVDDAGAVYVYNIDGTNEVKITAPDYTTNSPGGRFGSSVAATASTVLIGSSVDNNNGTDSGAIYYFDIDGTNSRKVYASEAKQTDYFSLAVAMTDTQTIVGSESYIGPGKVYVYDIDNPYDSSYSHAQGIGTIAQNKGMSAGGTYNIGTSTYTVHEFGIGNADDNRKNALEIYTDGTITVPEATDALISKRGDAALLTKGYGVVSDTAQGGAGSLKVSNMVRITQGDYDLITPDPDTFYAII